MTPEAAVTPEPETITPNEIVPVQTTYRQLPKFDARVKQPKVTVLVFKGNYYEERKAKIVDEHFLEFKTSDKVKHRKLICSEPAIMRTNRFFKKYTLIWCVGYFDEITKDPDKLKYDLPVLEAIGNLYKIIVDSKVAQKIAKEIKGTKMLREYIPWFLFFFSNVCWLIFLYSILDKVAMFKQ
jgi:hypothetical protein